MDAVGPISEEEHATLIEGPDHRDGDRRPTRKLGRSSPSAAFTTEQLQNSVRYIGKVMRHEAAVAAGFSTFDEAVMYAPLADGSEAANTSLRFLKWHSLLRTALEKLIEGKTDKQLLALKKKRRHHRTASATGRCSIEGVHMNDLYQIGMSGAAIDYLLKVLEQRPLGEAVGCGPG